MWLRGEGDVKVATFFCSFPTTIYDYFALPIDPISCAAGELGYTDGRIHPPHSGTANDSGIKNGNSRMKRMSRSDLAMVIVSVWTQNP